MNHSSPLTLQNATHRDSAWERAASYEKEERPIRPVCKIVVKGAKARVAGSGDIVIRGNPPIRDHSVAGSGDIKFKK
jgi:hypothetical protein